MNGQNGQTAKTVLVVDESHACKYRVGHDFIRWLTCPSGSTVRGSAVASVGFRHLRFPASSWRYACPSGSTR